MRISSYLLPLPLLVLAACVEPAEQPATNPDTDACQASQYQGLIGQPRSVLADMTFPAGTRIIDQGDAITMDFRHDRLNIEVSANGRIDKIGCF